jgi:WD40 repeat protein
LKKLSLILFLLLILPSPISAQEGDESSFPLPELEVISVENAERVTNLGTLEGISDWVLHAVFSDDGDILAATGYIDLHLWNVQTGEVLVSIACPELDNTYMGGVLFIPNSSLIAAACDSRIVFWDISQILNQEDSTPVRILQLSDNYPYDIAVDPEGRFIAAWDTWGKIWLGDIETGTEIFSVEAEDLCCLNFSPDGQYFAYSDDTETHLLDLETFDEVDVMSRSEVFNADWSLSADVDHQTGDIHLWGTGNDAPVILQNYPSPYDLSFNPDGDLLASGGGYAGILLWDTATYDLLVDIDTCGISDMTFSPNGKLIVTTHADAGGGCSLGVVLWGVPVEA